MNNEVNVPEEAVVGTFCDEAVEKLAERLLQSRRGITWRDLDDWSRAKKLEKARNHLAAIAPLLLADIRERLLGEEVASAAWDARLAAVLNEIVWRYAATQQGRCPNFEEVPEECDCAACKAVTLLAEWEDSDSAPPPQAVQGQGDYPRDSEGRCANCGGWAYQPSEYCDRCAPARQERCGGSGEVFPHPPDERDGYVQAEQCRGCPDCQPEKGGEG